MATRYHGAQQLRPGFPSVVRLWVRGTIRIGTNKFNYISMLYVNFCRYDTGTTCCH
jgi:hypothetical protein